MHRAELPVPFIQISGLLGLDLFSFEEKLSIKLKYIMVNADERASGIFTEPQGVSLPSATLWDFNLDSSKEKRRLLIHYLL